jgi:ADYC domain
MYVFRRRPRPGAGWWLLLLLLPFWGCAADSPTPPVAPAIPAPAPSTPAANPALKVASSPGLEVIAGHFELAQPLGERLRGAKLVGVEFGLGDARFVITAAERDPADPADEVELYRLSRIGDGNKTPVCPDGGPVFPMAGSWSAAGRHLHDDGFGLICAGSPAARCVEFGYRPWRATAAGKSLWDHHEACSRALKADYCGSGTAHAGVAAGLDVYDYAGIRALAAPPGDRFEAAWGAAGALCVRAVRPSARLSLKDLRTECPSLPQAKLGDSCDEREPALIYSKSPN